MTRLSTPSPPVALDLPQAFRLLGRGPSYSELAWVADRLRESGVEVEYSDTLVEIAEASGSGPFVALDLAVVASSGVEALTRGPRRRPFDQRWEWP